MNHHKCTHDKNFYCRKCGTGIFCENEKTADKVLKLNEDKTKLLTQYLNDFDKLINSEKLDIDEKINSNNELIRDMGIAIDKLNKNNYNAGGRKLTRIDKAMNNIKEAKAEITKYQCPAYLDCGESRVDRKTAIEDKTGQVIGCRYITCIACWNMEVD